MPPGTAGPVVLRLARLDDAAQITAIHQSHIPRWYRKIGDETYDVSYDSLTIDERWGFGGPWMSVESCVIHLNNLLLRRCLPIVAQAGDRVVAEMELFIGREGPPFVKNCHIGLLYVHNDYLGQGIGARLVARAVEAARESRCDTLTVASEPQHEEFYRQQGFRYHDVLVHFEAPPDERPVRISRLPAPLNIQSYTWGMDMRIGRLQSSAYHLFDLAESYAVPSYSEIVKRTEYLEVEGHRSAIAFASHVSGRTMVGGWTSGADAEEMANAMLATAHAAGYRSLNVLLAKKDYDRISGDIGARPLGIRRTLLYKL